MSQSEDETGSGHESWFALIECGQENGDESTRPGPIVTIRELPNGCTLYRQENGVGGYVYYSDEIGGGVHVWDSSIVDPSTLMAAMCDEATLRYEAARLKENAQQNRQDS